MLSVHKQWLILFWILHCARLFIFLVWPGLVEFTYCIYEQFTNIFFSKYDLRKGASEKITTNFLVKIYLHTFLWGLTQNFHGKRGLNQGSLLTGVCERSLILNFKNFTIKFIIVKLFHGLFARQIRFYSRGEKSQWILYIGIWLFVLLQNILGFCVKGQSNGSLC